VVKLKQNLPKPTRGVALGFGGSTLGSLTCSLGSLTCSLGSLTCSLGSLKHSLQPRQFSIVIRHVASSARPGRLPIFFFFFSNDALPSHNL
jgi:hypothetical protein